MLVVWDIAVEVELINRRIKTRIPDWGRLRRPGVTSPADTVRFNQIPFIEKAAPDFRRRHGLIRFKNLRRYRVDKGRIGRQHKVRIWRKRISNSGRARLKAAVSSRQIV